MKRWQPCCYQRVLMACGGSLASPWLPWSSGLPRSKPRTPRFAMSRTGTQSHQNPGPTWRQASSCHASSVTSTQNLSGCRWRTSIHFTTRTRGWEFPSLYVSDCDRGAATNVLSWIRTHYINHSGRDKFTHSKLWSQGMSWWLNTLFILKMQICHSR